MAWFTGAKKMELQPESDNQVAIRPTQFIIHSIAAPWTRERIYEYWRDSTNLESHFGLSFDGGIAQFIGTQTRADANASANRWPDGSGAVSVETASNLKHTDPWTDAQIRSLIQIGAWLNKQHGVPLRVSRSAQDPGYGFHRLHRAWSTTGTDCPGDARVEQFYDEVMPGIVAAANGQTPTKPPTPSISLLKLVTAAIANPPAKGTPVTYTGVGLVEDALAAEGLLHRSLVDGHFGTATVSAYSAWQRELGYVGDDANGIPGIQSLTKLGARHGFKAVA